MNPSLNQLGDILALRVIGDALTAAAYFAIPVIIFVFLYRQNRKVPVNRLTVSCGAFIFFCFLTRSIDIWEMWRPWYVLEGWIKLLGGIGSCVALVEIIPALPSVLGRDAAEVTNMGLVRELAGLRAASVQSRNRDVIKAVRLRALARDLARYAEQMDVEIPVHAPPDDTRP